MSAGATTRSASGVLATLGTADDTRELAARLLGLDDDDGFLQRSPLSRSWTVELLSDESRPGPGSVIDGYELLEHLGAGGMSEVWTARHSELPERIVALKIIDAAFFSLDSRRYFDRERRVLATLEHPNIARLYDAGLMPDGRGYLVMERIEGTHIDRYCSAKGLSQAGILRLLMQVCDALTFAHQKLIVHSDLKPSNILVDSSGNVRLIDFGIAEFVSRGEELSGAALYRRLTPVWASPEQLEGGPVTTLSDICSLAVVGWKLLTQEFPPDEPGGALPKDLRAILAKALQRRPEDRYASAKELKEDIARFLSGRPVLARPGHRLHRLRLFIRRNGLACTAGVLLAGAIGSGLAATWHQMQRAERSLQNARTMLGNLVSDGFAVFAQQSGSAQAAVALHQARTAYLEILREDAAGDAALARELLVSRLYEGSMQGQFEMPNVGNALAAEQTLAETLILARQLARNSGTPQDRINLAMALTYRASFTRSRRSSGMRSA